MGAYWQQIMCCLLSGQRFYDRVAEIISDLVGGQVLTEWIPASAIRSSGANAATAGVNGIGMFVYSFADGLDRRVQFNMRVPRDMDLSKPCTFCIGWSSPTVAQNAIMDLAYLISAPGDDTEGLPTTDPGLVFASSAVADGLVISNFTEIPGGTIGPGDVCFHVILERDGNNVNDTLGDVLELHGVSLRYTSKQYGV